MTIRGLRKTFNDAVVYDDFAVDLPLGHFIFDLRSERLRQEHVDQHGLRPDADGRRRGSV